MNGTTVNNHRQRPVIGIVPGDPNGVGAEILVKVWATRTLNPQCRPLVIGCGDVVKHAIRITGVDLQVRSIANGQEFPADLGDDERVIDVLEAAAFPVDAIRFGHDVEAAGAISGVWLDQADRLAREGVLEGTVMGPISGKAMDKAGTLASVASHKSVDPAFLLLRSGRLFIAHLTDHLPLADVSAAITPSSVHGLIVKLAGAMSAWGLGRGKIGVAGFNPHATGREEAEAIMPAVTQAQREGIDVEGPISPDSIFRQCIEGRYDAVIAMYHDQGHIAIKTWGFSGNSVLFLGPPYPHTTVAHGVAYDLAGTGRADSSMIQNAILNAASLAAGRGFHVE